MGFMKRELFVFVFCVLVLTSLNINIKQMQTDEESVTPTSSAWCETPLLHQARSYRERHVHETHETVFLLKKGEGHHKAT